MIQLILYGNHISSLDGKTKDIGESHRKFCDVIHIVEQSHIPDTLKRIIEKVRIDLASIGKDLCLFFGKFRFIGKIFYLLDLQLHLLLFIEHLIQAFCDCADLIRTVEGKPGVRILIDLTDKSRNSGDRFYDAVIAVQKQKEQKTQGNAINQDLCFFQALIRFPKI